MNLPFCGFRGAEADPIHLQGRTMRLRVKEIQGVPRGEFITLVQKDEWVTIVGK